MLDPGYRNPAWVTNQVVDENGERPVWSARFRMPTQRAVDVALEAFTDAGASRTASQQGSTEVVVEFDAVLVRRIAATAVAHGGVLVEMARALLDMLT